MSVGRPLRRIATVSYLPRLHAPRQQGTVLATLTCGHVVRYKGSQYWRSGRPIQAARCRECGYRG